VKKILLCVFLFFCLAGEYSFGQLTFQKTYGGIGADYGYQVHQTYDGGYVIAGRTSSFGYGSFDAYVIKTKANGDTLWTRTFGEVGDDYINGIEQTSDSGYIMVGYTNSFGVNNYDIYVIKTDSIGEIIWSKTYGGAGNDRAFSIKQTNDGGYILTGYTSSSGAGGNDVCLIKTDNNGDTLWTKVFGGSGNDQGYVVLSCIDGGYIVEGYSSAFGKGSGDFYVIRTDDNGDTLWTRTYGSTLYESPHSIYQTADSGYVLAGSTTMSGEGWTTYLFKISATGVPIWAKTYGAFACCQGSYGSFAQPTNDGGSILTGYYWTYVPGDYSTYIIRTNSVGDTLWTKLYGGINYEEGDFASQTTDGGLIIVGATRSWGAGYYDVYLIKTDSAGYAGCAQYNTTTKVENAIAAITHPATAVNSFALTVSFQPTQKLNGATIRTQCPCSLSLTVSQDSLIPCYGSTTSATATPSGGTSPYTYSWNTGDTTATINNVPAGNYTVTVTDSVGCSATQIVSITQPPILTATVSVLNNVLCNGGSTGCANVTVSGGTAPYTYVWWPPALTTDTACGLPAGCYTVNVTDANGCTVMDTVCITEPEELLNDDFVLQNVSCNGGIDGAAIAVASGGTPPYTYGWPATGCTTDTCGHLSAGNYVVSVTDANGCIANNFVTITEPPVLIVTACEGNPPLCQPDPPCVYVCAYGGTLPYSYLWNPVGATTATVCNLAAGTYTLTVTDANNCTGASQVTLSQNSTVANSSTSVDASCSTCSDGVIAVTTTGGTPAYTYQWTPSVNTTATASNLSPGIYTCCVMDANGCTACSVDTVSYPTSIENITANDAILIHPNPFTGELIVTFGKKEEAVITLYDYTGKEILRTISNSVETVLNTEGLAAGLYLLRVDASTGSATDGRGVANYRVVKEN
jgi:hypothetical protein